MIIGRDLLEATEKRYAERTKEREETKEKLKQGKVLECDSKERIRKRISRLGSHTSFSEARLQHEVASSPENSDQVLTLIRNLALERVLGKNDLMPIHFLEAGIRVARTVCRIQIRNAAGGTLGFGTGFLVSPNLLLTNNHVLGQQEAAAFSRAEFDFQEALDGRNGESAFFALDPRRFFISDRELDYTLVAVNPIGTAGAELRRFGWNRLIAEQGKAIIGEYVTIIQHPNGSPKHIALRENRIVDIPNELFVHYETDTAPGSSGSPVFNDQWEVVALHHSGVIDKNQNDEPLALNGGVWKPSMGESQIKWKANEGARISRIVAHVQAADFRGIRGGLVEEMLQGPGPVFETPREAGGGLVLGAGGGMAVAAGTTGVGMVTLPINLTINLGAPAAVALRPLVPAILPARSAQPSGTALKDRDEALEEVERSKRRNYFDAAADIADAAGYYGDLNPDGSRTNGFRMLNRLVKSTHKNFFTYKPAKHLYPWVDLHPNFKLRSIYSGREVDAEELILEDFRIEMKRDAQIQEILARESTWNADQIRMELDELEAQAAFNCEHVVPQSYFAKREPMRGDLHHLFACASDCNSFRGNIPYFQFPLEEEVVRPACGRREENKFEPQSGKGEVARATLYFLLRYPGLIDDTQKEYEEARIETLLGWHKEFQVSDYERHRNQAIFQMQGNRNPLIDHPDWSEGIDFALGLG
jgi:endonuclease G, mitochondrial